jgi:uncharacterized protein (DUF305 family)
VRHDSTGVRPLIVVLTVAAMSLLTACATSERPTSSDRGPVATSASPATSAATSATASPVASAPRPTSLPTVAVPALKGTHNDIDVMFATDMIPHHRQAVEMAVMARTQGDDPRIKAIADRIEHTQGTEVALMVGWLKAWGKKVPAPDQLHTAHGPGMVTHAEMEELKEAKGFLFDWTFADLMIRHHQGALEMADMTKKTGKNASVRALASNVVITQTAEIKELTEILNSL